MVRYAKICLQIYLQYWNAVMSIALHGSMCVRSAFTIIGFIATELLQKKGNVRSEGSGSAVNRFKSWDLPGSLGFLLWQFLFTKCFHLLRGLFAMRYSTTI